MPTKVLKNKVWLIAVLLTLAGHPLFAELTRAARVLFCKGMLTYPVTKPFKQPFAAPRWGSASLQGRIAGRDSAQSADWSTSAGACAERPSRHFGREAGAAWRKESCGGKKGQTLKLPGCGLRARMLSVLSTSWQQHLGPGSSSPLR